MDIHYVGNPKPRIPTLLLIPDYPPLLQGKKELFRGISHSYL
jgi:hypothetical protein